MRALRQLAAVVALFILVCALLAWLLPGRLDWVRYRGTLAAYASGAVGRPVRIDGPVSLALLPEPTLVAGRIAVADSGDGVSLTAASLQLRLSLGALLAGRIEPRELVLRSPVLRLPWPGAAAMASHRPTWLRLVNARIEDGRLEVGWLNLTGVSASVAPDALTATLVASARGQWQGQAWRMTARLGTRDAQGTAGLQAGLEGEAAFAGLGAAFTGSISGDGALAGSLSAHGADLSRLLPAPPVAWSGQGQLRGDDGVVALSDLALRAGEASIDGSARLTLDPAPRLEMRLTSGQIGMDGWLRALPGAGLHVPVPMTLDLTAPVASLEGGALSGLHASLTLDGTTGTLHEASVTLPGDMRLRLAGTMSAGPRFAGSVRLEADEPRAALGWLAGGDPPALPAGVLQRLTLAGNVTIAPDLLEATELIGTLDDSPLTGAASWRRAGPLALRLGLDHLKLEPLLEPAAFEAWRTRAADWMARPGGLDLALRVGRLEWRGAAFDRVVLDGGSRDGAVTLRAAQAGWGGAQASLSGRREADGAIADGKLLLIGPDASPLLALLPAPWANIPRTLWRAPLDLEWSAAGPQSALAGRLQARLGDVRLDARPVLDLPAQSGRADATLSHPSAGRLLGLFGLADGGDWLGEGSASISASLSGSLAPARVAAERLDLVAGQLRAHGALTLADADGPLLSGRLAAERLPVPRAALLRGPALRREVLRGWRAGLALSATSLVEPEGDLIEAIGPGAATLSLSQGVVRLDTARLRLDRGEITGSARIDTNAEPPEVAVSGRLDHIDGGEIAAALGLHGGSWGGVVEAHSGGYAAAGLRARLSGSAQLSLSGGKLSGGDAVALRAGLATSAGAAVERAMAGGETALQGGSVIVHGQDGLLRLSGSLQAEATAIGLDGSVDLANDFIDVSLLWRAGIGDVPGISQHVVGPLAAPGRGLELNALASWLARH